MPPDDIYPSFTVFVESVVLLRLLEHPARKRLDGWEKGGNIAVAGRFPYDGDEWLAHEDCHFEALLLAYWSTRTRGEAQTFERADTKHGVRLDLAPELEALHGELHRYFYLNLDE